MLWTNSTTQEEANILYHMEVRHVEVPENAYMSSSCDQSVYLVTVLSKRRNSVVSIVPRLWAGRFRVQFPAGARNLSFLQNIQAGCGAHPAFHSVDTRVDMGGGVGSCRAMKLTTRLHPVSILRISGAVPPPPPMFS